MSARSRIFVRDDRETELSIDYEIDGGSEASGQYGPPEDYDPGCAPEIIIGTIEPLTELTEAEIERFEQEVLEDPDLWEVDEPDYD